MASSGNFCTLNRLVGAASNGRVNSGTMSLGNLKYEDSHSTGDAFVANMAMTGKTYCEVRIDSIGNYGGVIGLRGTGAYSQVYDSVTFQTNYSSGLLYHYKGSSDQSASGNIGGTVSAGNILMFAYDPATYKWWVGVNGTWRNSGDPANGSGEIFTGSATMFETMDITWGGWVGDVNGLDTTWNFGQDSTFGGVETAGGNADDNGFGDFKYSPPTGFLALCTGNMSVSDNIDPAQTDDNIPTKQFNAITWTGNRTSNSTVNNITGVGFQPDLVWLKILNNTYDHRLVDSSRGVTEAIRSNKTTAEQTEANGLYQFGSDGFSVKGDNNYNSNGDPFIGYCWRANGGTTASNSDGDITSTVQANTNAGFSIVTYTGDNTDHRGVGYGSANIGHGLDSAPEFIITKRRDGTGGWYTLHASAGIGYLSLESSGTFQSGAVPFGPALPTTTTFGGYSANNNSSHTYVCYCWHSVEGYSKFGSFEGNANADGPFIYTGFRPRLLFIKNIDSSSAWGVYDGERPGFNDCDLGAWNETTGYNNNIGSYPCDILSNGFKLRTSNSTVNSSHTWVYGAWGDVPFKYNNTF